ALPRSSKNSAYGDVGAAGSGPRRADRGRQIAATGWPGAWRPGRPAPRLAPFLPLTRHGDPPPSPESRRRVPPRPLPAAGRCRTGLGRLGRRGRLVRGRAGWWTRGAAAGSADPRQGARALVARLRTR